MSHFPFAAIVGSDDLGLALILTTVAPDVGGVLVRGEKGTAKSTMVRALADVLPDQEVLHACRFGCEPARPDTYCPDGPHGPNAPAQTRPARLVELPVGATEDRVIGSLDLSRALGAGETAFEPGLLAQAHRGILYVDEVNLLHDHLVDLLLDAAAMGRNTVERDGVSVSHAARMVLVGTMNPEEGELRPQLLDRFGLTVEVAASRNPDERVEIVRRRLAFDADPEGFTRSYAGAQADLQRRILAAQGRLASVVLDDRALRRIAIVCAGFDVDGMRADLVTARAARAHAAWRGDTEVTRDDIRVAARLALPHRRRRNPFDAPGLDEELLERLLSEGDDDPTPPDDPDAPPEDPSTPPDTEGPDAGGSGQDGPSGNESHQPESGDASTEAPRDATASADSAHDVDADAPPGGATMSAVADAGTPYRARTFTLRGVGQGEAGRRSRAITSWGHTIGATTTPNGRLHLPATLIAAAPHQGRRGRTDRVLLHRDDLRHRVTVGRESNLVLMAVDASGSMGARQRMSEVKTAVLSLLVDAYQRRDRVAVVTFHGDDARLALPATNSVEAAARCLSDLPHGGRTPLAEGLTECAKVLRLERIRDPRRRPLLVLITDGRATSGPNALARARDIADRWPGLGIEAVVVDCEAGHFRLGLAADLAQRMGAEHLPLRQVAAETLVDIVAARTDLQRKAA